MGWPFSASQQNKAQPTTNPKPQTKKRVSFAPGQPTTCPPPPPKLKSAMKQVHFTPDTKPGSRRSNSGGSSKTRWPSPPRKTPPTKGGTAGLSSVGRDFNTRKPAIRPSSGTPRTAKPDARVSIPIKGESYNGPPKSKHQRPGYEWVSYEIKVKPTGKVWRR